MIPVGPADPSSVLYIMRASGALGDKATKFFLKYFEQAGIMDPKNQVKLPTVASEDALQIIAELESAYNQAGRRLQTAEMDPIEFRVLERETPEEATLRVLRDIAAVDEKGRAQRKVQAKAAPTAEPKAKNVTAFDATDGLTEEGVIIDQLDDLREGFPDSLIQARAG